MTGKKKRVVKEDQTTESMRACGIQKLGVAERRKEENQTDRSSDAQPSRCRHVSTAGQLTMKDILTSKKQPCAVCSFSGKNRWLCLHSDCLSVFCGSKRGDHAHAHQQNTKHPLQLHLTSWNVWCTECECKVLPDCNIPGWAVGEALLSGKGLQRIKGTEESKLAALVQDGRPAIHRSASASSGVASMSSIAPSEQERSIAPSQVPQATAVQTGGVAGREYVAHEVPQAMFRDIEDDEDKHNPRGLTGLRNLGNTCYMNAALQALSNCPPLADYFRYFDVLPSSRERTGPPGISEHYKELLEHLWSPSRPGCLIPSRLLTLVRGSYPSFRGWQQQDSQEFLRCFLDLLHQDMKQPMYWWELRQSDNESEESSGRSSPDNSSTDASANADTDSFETADSGCNSDQETPGSSVRKRRQRSSSPQYADARSDVGLERWQSSARRPKIVTKALADDHTVPKKKPVAYRSVVTDVFDGRISSTVECLTCKHVSETVESFQDLSLPIPTTEQLERIRSLAVEQSHSDMSVGQGQQSWLSWAYGWMCWMSGWLRGPDVSLQDCLSAFFSVDDLRGDDMYSCEKCGKLRNGVKLCQLLSLPEMLCVHLKRFRHDMSYSSKVSTTVRFPLDDLDMSPYLHTDADSRVTHYELVAIVTHYGGAEGGHYVAYCRNELNRNWYEFDDSCVSVVEPLEVLDKEAYVLFYQKRDDRADRVRAEAQRLLEAQTPQSKGLLSFYISQEWLQRFGTFAEPGPVTNYDFLCPHGYIAPTKAANLTSHYAEINARAWDLLFERFGGGPVCSCLQYCLTCQQQHLRLQVKRTAELAAFHKINKDVQTRSYDPSKRSQNVIARRWFKAWEAFVLGHSLEPPGQIDNESLLVSMPNGDKYLRSSASFNPISLELWEFFLSVYGGGPEVFYHYQPQPREEKQEAMECE